MSAVASIDFRCQLSTVAKVLMGQSPDSSTYNDQRHGIPFLQGNAEFGERHPTHRLYCTIPNRVCAENDILLSVRAPVGATNQADQSYAIGRGLAAVRFNEQDQGYGWHALRHAVPQLDLLAQGSTFAAVSKKEIAELSVWFPEPELRPKIASILDLLERAIEQAKALLAKQQRIKAGLMHDLLTCGLDSQGRLRDPSTHRFKPSPLGLIPEEWEVSNCQREFSIDSGITLGPTRVPRLSPRAYLRVANVHRSRIIMDDVAALEASDKEVASLALQTFDLLVVEGHANRAEIGRCAMVFHDAEGLLFQNHLFRLRPHRLRAPFGLLWLNSAHARRYWELTCSTSSGLNTINRTMLGGMPVFIPDKAEQDRMLALISAFDAQHHHTERDLTKLRRLKTGLMHDLLTGKRSVSPLLSTSPV